MQTPQLWKISVTWRKQSQSVVKLECKCKGFPSFNSHLLRGKFCDTIILYIEIALMYVEPKRTKEENGESERKGEKMKKKRNYRSKQEKWNTHQERKKRRRPSLHREISLSNTYKHKIHTHIHTHIQAVTKPSKTTTAQSTILTWEGN